MPSLDWIGKDAVVGSHRRAPYHLVHCNGGLSAGEADSPNLLICGDNLLALKAILPYYAGKIDRVYIDPPYNTGSADVGNSGWAYNDRVDSPAIRRWLEKTVGDEAKDMTRHDKWLCMMHPRLCLLRQLLAPDGLIFASIDDNESHHLRTLMDSVFRPANRLATMTWRGMHTVRNSSKDFSKNTEYVLCYAKNLRRIITPGKPETYLRVPVDKEGDYPRNDQDGKGPYKLDPLHARNFYTPYAHTFLNGVIWSPPANRYPAYSRETLLGMDEAGEIDFRGGEPKARRYLRRVQEGVPPSTLLPAEEVGFNKDGTAELSRIFGGRKVFNQPKPVALVKYLLSIQSQKQRRAKRPLLVLDSFAGSGTTGQAVLEAARDDKRQMNFILIEMDEKNCREVAKERLARVVRGYDSPEGEKIPGLGGGFRFCELGGKPMLDENGGVSARVKFPDLAAHVFFSETGVPIPKKADGKTPLLGEFGGKAVYLLFNGAAGGKRGTGGNILTARILSRLPRPKRAGSRLVIYGEGCPLTSGELADQSADFRQIPYEVSAS